MDCRPHSVHDWVTLAIILGACCGLALLCVVLTPLNWALCAVVVLVVFLTLGFWRVPMLGIYAATLIYPISSIIIVVRAHTPYEVMLHLIELLTLPLLFARVLGLLSNHTPAVPGRRRVSHRWVSWCLLLLVPFFASTVVAVFRSNSPVMSAYGMWRLLAALILVDYLVAHLDSIARIRRVLWFYCAVGVIVTIAAVTATHFAFSVRLFLFECFGSYVFCQVALFNMVSDFLAVLVGETSGYGLCAKHDLSLFMFAGVIIALFLFLTTRGKMLRILLCGLILCFEAMVFQAQSKLSLVGGLMVVGLFTVFVSPWRRRAVAILAVFIGLNVAGALCAGLLAPSHGKKVDSPVAGLQNATSASEYEPSSFAGRRMIWRRTIARVRREHMMGSGPDSLGKEFAFGVPHGHNLFLTVLTECGIVAAVAIFTILLTIATTIVGELMRGAGPQDNHWLLLAALTACTLFTLFEYQFDMPVYRTHLWYMLGLLLAGLKVQQQAATEDERL